MKKLFKHPICLVLALLALTCVYFFGFGHMAGTAMAFAALVTISPDDDDETKKAKQIIIDSHDSAIVEAEKKAKSMFELEKKSLKEAHDLELKTATDKIEKELKLEIKSVQDHADKLDVKIKGLGSISSKPEVKSFNDVLAETLEANKEAVQSFKKGSPEVSMEIKAVGDMSIPANFPNSTPWTQDVRDTLIETPYNRVWLGDLLPGGSSTGSSILYPKENGGEGGVALWTDKTQDKAQMDLDLTSQSAHFKWLAGIVIVDREMLDDIAWLTSYLQKKMLISLKTAENAFILNGSADTNPVQGMLAAATAYDGDFIAAVDRIIDAGWGQIIEDTFEFYSPTTTILTPRDTVKIGLNKATGSGEYDLPAGSVVFTNGKLTVGGLGVAPSTQIGTGNFLTFDRNATAFVKRMQPELRMFEDAALAKKNKIMFRIEERATLAIFNNNALVKGTLEATT
jgi:HK97 family phage major capsid protein